MDKERSQEGGDHEHCRSCYSSTCRMSSPSSSCPIIQCSLRCGAKFHACKESEHGEICQFERVACINQVNGCPLVVARSQLGAHLATCPASVVYCTMEWNRWPIYSRERQSRVPFITGNMHAQYGQLDVALALRDQRMLNASLKIPRSTRSILRNNLTQRFPAVPIPHSTEGGQVEDNIVTSSAMETAGQPQDTCSGSEECCRDLSTEERGQGSQADASDLDVSSEISDQFRSEWKSTTEMDRILLQKQLYLSSNQLPNGNKEDTLTEGGVNRAVSVNETDGTDTENCRERTADQEELGRVPPREQEIEQELQQRGGGQPEVYNEAETGAGAPVLSINAEVGANVSVVSLNTETDADAPGVPVDIDSMVPAPPSMFPRAPLQETLALDLNLESITRYQAKPRSMYTFLCAQEFRRDEYLHHCKNVHDEIHSGLGSWLEQRCPLAQYGCSYAVRRMCPDQTGSQIVHSSTLESFGVQSCLPDQHATDSDSDLELATRPAWDKETDDPPRERATVKTNAVRRTHVKKKQQQSMCSKSPAKFSLTDHHALLPALHPGLTSPEGNARAAPVTGLDLCSLPFEILRHVARFLDSFSLCNVALTNHLLREVACSMLEEKGIVIQQWERRVREGGQPSWVISHKRWIFSTAFTPIRQWRYENFTPLGNHLQTCPYYHRRRPAQPYRLPNLQCGQHHSQGFSEVMRRMYPDFTIEETTTEAECNGNNGLCCP